ncbi:MAG: hypothetical protein R2771_15400 [Saprospiraceae bacterium]
MNSKKYLFRSHFQNLYEDKVIYYERNLVIADLESIVITEDYFSAIVNPLILIPRGNKFDKYFVKNKKFSIHCRWEQCKYIGTALASYHVWMIWTEPELVKKLEQLVFENRFEEALALTLNEDNN